MSVSAVFVKTPVHDGLSTTPMEFRIVQEHMVKEKAKSSEDTKTVSFRDFIHVICHRNIPTIVAILCSRLFPWDDTCRMLGGSPTREASQPQGCVFIPSFPANTL